MFYRGQNNKSYFQSEIQTCRCTNNTTHYRKCLKICHSCNSGVCYHESNLFITVTIYCSTCI